MNMIGENVPAVQEWIAEANCTDGYKLWEGTDFLLPQRSDILRLTLGSMRYVVHSMRGKEFGEQFARHYYRAEALGFAIVDDKYVLRQSVTDALVEEAMVGRRGDLHSVNLTIGADFIRCLPGAQRIEIKRLPEARI